jgi:hypothetical protein
MAKSTVRQEARTTLPRRRRRVLDVIILVAATAIACPLTTWIAQETNGGFSWGVLCERVLSLFDSSNGQGRTLEWIVGLCSFFFLLLTPFAATWTIALVSIQLSGRREPLRRLASRPGAAAALPAGCICIILIIFISIKLFLIGLYISHSNFFLEFILLNSPMLVGASVFGSWMMLLIGKRWNADSSWDDRLGRALGAYWLIAGAASTALQTLQ